MGRNGVKPGVRKGPILKQMRVHASPYQIDRKAPDPQEVKSVSEEASRKAVEIIQTAQGKAKLAEKEGFDRGLAQAKTVLESERKALEEGHAAKLEEALKKMEGDLIELVIAVAKKVIHAEVQQNREGVLGVIREGLANLGAHDSVVVRIAPIGDDGIKEKLSDTINAENKPKKIDVKEDKLIEPGGCVIESGPVVIDARVETQLGSIKDALHQAKDGSDGA